MAFFDKFRQKVNRFNDEYDDEMQNNPEEDYEQEEEENSDSGEYENYSVPSSNTSGGRVVSIQSSHLQVLLTKPKEFKEVREIASHLGKNVTVILNLTACSPEISTRILDFLGGAVFAHGGDVKPIADKTYLLIPKNVDLSGDMMDDLEDYGFSIGG